MDPMADMFDGETALRVGKVKLGEELEGEREAVTSARDGTLVSASLCQQWPLLSGNWLFAHPCTTDIMARLRVRVVDHTT